MDKVIDENNLLTNIVKTFKRLSLQNIKENKLEKLHERENAAFVFIGKLFKRNQVLIFGDFHASSKQHQTFNEVIKHLIFIGEKVDVFLEYKQCYQETMDKVLSGKDSYNRAFENKLVPKGNGYESIVDTCRKNGLRIVCFDIESESFESREKYMADMILNSQNKTIVMVGNKHLLKTKHNYLYSNKNIKYIKMFDYCNTFFEDKMKGYYKIIRSAKHKIICKSLQSEYDFDLIIPNDSKKNV